MDDNAQGSQDGQYDEDLDEFDLEDLAIIAAGNEELREKQRLSRLLEEATNTEKRSKVLIKDTHHAAVRIRLSQQYKTGQIPIKRWMQFWASRADKVAQVEIDNLMSVLRQSGIGDGLETLPVEGRSLLRVSEALAIKAGVTFPEVRYLSAAKGQYSYYGLQNGLLGKSIGNYHHDLAAFLEIVAAECPAMLGLYTTGAVSKPSDMDTSILGAFWHKTIGQERQQQQQQDEEQLQSLSAAAPAGEVSITAPTGQGGEGMTNDTSEVPEFCFRCFKCSDDGSPIPHFFFHFFNDGIQVFNNSVKKSMVVMMARVHSISPCFHQSKDDNLRILAPNLYPFIISVFHGHTGGEPANVEEWMQDFIAELMRLDGRGTDEEGLQKARLHQPYKKSPSTLEKARKVTAEIHMVIADGPARQVTKQCKGVMAYCHCEWCTQHGGIGKILIRRQRELQELQKQNIGAAAEASGITAIRRRGQKRSLPSAASNDEPSPKRLKVSMMGLSCKPRQQQPLQKKKLMKPRRKCNRGPTQLNVAAIGAKDRRRSTGSTWNRRRRRMPPLPRPHKFKELQNQHCHPNNHVRLAVKKSLKRALHISALSAATAAKRTNSHSPSPQDEPSHTNQAIPARNTISSKGTASSSSSNHEAERHSSDGMNNLFTYVSHHQCLTKTLHI